MSAKGTQPVKPLTSGLHFVFRPSACKIANASCTQAPAPPAISAFARDGFKPDGRKKLASAAITQGWPEGLTPQGAPPSAVGTRPTPFGPKEEAPEAGAVSAACQF